VFEVVGVFGEHPEPMNRMRDTQLTRAMEECDMVSF
jgi:hypothetical protein